MFEAVDPTRDAASIARVSLAIPASPAAAGHSPMQAPSLTVHDNTLFLEAEFENLPKLLALEAENGSLISLTNSGVILPAQGTPLPLWPVTQVCQKLACPFDPESVLLTMSGAAAIPKAQRHEAGHVGSTLSGMNLGGVDIQEIAEVVLLMIVQDNDQDMIKLLSQQQNEYRDRAAIAVAIRLLKDGAQTVYNQKWLDRA